MTSVFSREKILSSADETATNQKDIDMYTDLEIVTNIAKQLAELIESRALLADCTDFNDAEHVATLGRVSEEINELLELQEYYTGKIMTKQMKRAA